MIRLTYGNDFDDSNDNRSCIAETITFKTLLEAAQAVVEGGCDFWSVESEAHTEDLEAEMAVYISCIKAARRTIKQMVGCDRVGKLNLSKKVREQLREICPTEHAFIQTVKPADTSKFKVGQRVMANNEIGEVLEIRTRGKYPIFVRLKEIHGAGCIRQYSPDELTPVAKIDV